MTVEHSHVVGHTGWKPRTEARIAQKYYADRNAKVVTRRVNDARCGLRSFEQRQLVKPLRELTFQGLHTGHTTWSCDTSDEELIEAPLEYYPGAIIVVSHDRWLRKHWKGNIQDLAHPVTA